MSCKRIRPLELNELRQVVEYFYSASDGLLETMGVDRSKFPGRDHWQELLESDFKNDLTDRQFHYVGWEYDGELIGYSNIHKIEFGRVATAHVHIWIEEKRDQGSGLWFFRNSINHYFREFQLKTIVCEPCAKNPAPNKLLQKLGLTPVREYETILGGINFKQTVTRYEITQPFDDRSGR